MGVAMISIFNGQRRGPGIEEKDIWVKVNVAFREHLHLFKGAKLGVFLAISLHINQEGWAWPGVSLLSKETGYSKDIVSRALAELCQVTIDGYRVLLKYQPRIDKSEMQKGVFASNRYLFFPTPEEIARYQGAGIQHRAAKAPSRENPDTGKSSDKEEPSSKKKQRNNVLSETTSKQEPTVTESVTGPTAEKASTAGKAPVTEEKEPCDFLDIALHTKTAQDKYKYPIEYLAEVVVAELGLKRVPDYKFDSLWERPLSDLLNQAGVDEVEVALKAAVAKGRAGNITMTTPNSLHGLAMEALATPPQTSVASFTSSSIPDDYVELPGKRKSRGGVDRWKATTETFAPA